MATKDVGLLAIVLLIVAIGAGLAFAIICWAIIIWLWQVNPLWSVVAFIVWTLVFGGGLKVRMSK